MHSPYLPTNLISQHISQNQIEKVPASYSTETYFYENEGALSQKHVDKAWSVYEQIRKNKLKEFG